MHEPLVVCLTHGMPHSLMHVSRKCVNGHLEPFFATPATESCNPKHAKTRPDAVTWARTLRTASIFWASVGALRGVLQLEIGSGSSRYVDGADIDPSLLN